MSIVTIVKYAAVGLVVGCLVVALGRANAVSRPGRDAPRGAAVVVGSALVR
jgi:hypothetical protein